MALGILHVCVCVCTYVCVAMSDSVSARWHTFICAKSGECQLVVSVSLPPFRCSMSVEDGAKLYDVCPHVSDLVCSHELLSVTSDTSTLNTKAVSQRLDFFKKAHNKTEINIFIVCK